MSMGETEVFVIAHVDFETNVVSFRSNARWSHFGGAKPYQTAKDLGTLDMRSVCGVLSRNISISSEKKALSDFGGRFLTTFFKKFNLDDQSKTVKWRGVTILEGVEFSQMGGAGANAGFHV
jgi:hypothetical protein